MWKSANVSHIHLHDAVGTDEDDEEAEPVTRKRVRMESAVASKKLEKDGPVAKLKKKARVLVEVIINILGLFWLYFYSLSFVF